MKRIITLALGIVLIFACLPIATICVNAEQTELLTGGEWLQGFRTIQSTNETTKAAIRTDTDKLKRRAYYSKLIDVTEGKEYTLSFKGRAGDGIKVLQLKSDGTSIVSNTNYWVGRDLTSEGNQFYYKENFFTATITPASGVTQIGFSLFNEFDDDSHYNSNKLGIKVDYARIKNDVSNGIITCSFKGDVTTSGVDLAVTANMKSGAAIRLTNGNGLRFITAFDADKIARLQELGATVELGTLIAPKDLLGENDLTFGLDSSKYVDVKYEAKNADSSYIWHDNDNGDNAGQIAGSIVGIKESGTKFSAENGNIARDFVGRGYVKVTLDGTTVITYASYASGDIANNTRSLASVAQALKDDTAKYNALDSDIKSLVDNWASKLPTK